MLPWVSITRPQGDVSPPAAGELAENTVSMENGT